MSKPALAALLLAMLLSSPIRADSVQEVQALVRQGQLHQALQMADQLLGARPRDAQLRFLKGVVLSELNRGSEAVVIFQKLTEDYPELPEPYNNLAVLYAQQRQYDKARNALEMAIRTHPSYATAHENLGDIYARLASQAYDKALALDSSNAAAQNKLAMIREMISVGSAKPARPASPPPAAPAARPPAAAASPAAVPAPPPPVAALAAAKPVATQPPAAPTEKPATPTAAPLVKPITPAPAAPAAAAKAAPPPPAAPAPVAKEEVRTDTRRSEPKDETAAQAAAITKAVTGWAGAWSKKDVKSYLGYYARDFDPPKGMSRKAWEEERSQRLTKPGDIEVKLDDIRVVSASGERATVKLRQHYRSATLSSSSNKTLGLVRQDGRWLIHQERVGG